MISSEHIESTFIDWPENIEILGSGKQKGMFWTSLSTELALVQDNETNEMYKTAYYLFYRFKLELDDDKPKTIFSAIYQSQYLINFEKDKSELSDFVKLFNESKNRMREAFKNKIIGTPIKGNVLPDIKTEHAIKIIRNLFDIDLPKHNLR